MKITILLVCLMFFTSMAEAAPTPKNRVGWAFLYGHGQNDNELNFSPSGKTYKLIFGLRFNNLELSGFLRFADLNEDITFQNTQGNIKNQTVTAAFQAGFWVFPWLNLHTGYARHGMQKSLKGDYTAAQATALNSTYDIENKKTMGLFAGADLVLLQSPGFQLFANYDHYRLNNIEAKEWEVMAGIRFYFESKGTSEGLFSKLIEAIFRPKSK